MKANSRLSFEGGNADSRFRKRMSRNAKWLEGFGPDLQQDKQGKFCPKNMIRDSYDHYRFFMNEFGPRLVGVKYYKEKHAEVVPEEWLSVAGEGFGILTLENYYASLVKELENNIRCPAKYTKNGDAKRNQGWSQEGLDRHQSFCEVIATLRENDEKKKERDGGYETYGDRYLKEKKEERDLLFMKRGKKRKEETARNREAGWQEGYHNLDSLVPLRPSKVLCHTGNGPPTEIDTCNQADNITGV